MRRLVVACVWAIATVLAGCGGAKDSADAATALGISDASLFQRTRMGILKPGVDIVADASESSTPAAPPPRGDPLPTGLPDHSKMGPAVDTSKYATVTPSNK